MIIRTIIYGAIYGLVKIYAGKLCGSHTGRREMLMYGKEASNRKQEIDRQHHTIPNQRNQRNQRPKDKHCGKI